MRRQSQGSRLRIDGPTMLLVGSTARDSYPPSYRRFHHDARKLAGTVSHALRHPHAVPVHRHQQRAAGTPGVSAPTPCPTSRGSWASATSDSVSSPSRASSVRRRGLPAERRHPGRRALGRPAHHPRRGARSGTHPRHARGAQQSTAAGWGCGTWRCIRGSPRTGWSTSRT